MIRKYKEMYVIINKICNNIFAIVQVIGIRTGILYVVKLLRKIKTVKNDRSLISVDRGMAGMSYKYRVFPGKTISLDGEFFALAREICCRKVYFALPDFTINADDIVVDLGSNTGIFTTVAAKYGKKVVSVEAQSEFIPIIKSNLLKNSCSEKAVVINALIGAESGVFSDVSKREYASHWKKNPPSLSLNDIIVNHSIPKINFLKIDIEGSEFALFKNDIGWLSIVDKIAMEVHAEYGNPEEVYEIIRKSGFTVWRLHEYQTISQGHPYTYIFAKR